MGTIRLYVFWFFLAFTFQAYGQSDFLFKSSLQDIDLKIEEAKSLVGKDNERATNIISEIIELAKSVNDYSSLMEAYSLLGDLNANVGLNKIALSRYREALLYAGETVENAKKATIYLKLGNLNLEGKVQNAKTDYKSCMDLVVRTELYYLCYEGLAGALQKQDSLDSTMKILSELESYYYKRDSSDLSRIQAKKAIVASAQNRLDIAQLNYSNARANFDNRNNRIEDIKIINSAKELISISQNTIDDEIDFRETNISDYKEDDNTYQIEDQIQLANAYIKKGDLNNATRLITTAKGTVSDKVNVNTKSKVYKEASELSALRGDYEMALAEYQIYESTQQELLDSKQREVESKISLLESQKKIDIEANIYDSNQKLGRSESKLVDFQKYVIYLLTSLLLLSLLSALWIYRSLRSKRLSNKKLELKTLKAQMNPHFIFNALNSVNEYIATQDDVSANKYLSQFSRLMRKVLDVNQKDLIPISEELELTDLYLKLEHSRFRDQFDYNFNVDSFVMNQDVHVSPMLLQPYIENAIWHGLRYKISKGILNVNVNMKNDIIDIVIEDNGIGRKESLGRKTMHQREHKATGMKNTAKRMSIIEELYKTKYSIDISDAFSDQTDKGTRVHIKLFLDHG